MFRIDQDRLDQNKHDPEIQEYFHRVEYQNKLRLPHIAKTQFFIKIEYESPYLLISYEDSYDQDLYTIST